MLVFGAVSCVEEEGSPYTEKRARCAEHNPLKNAYFGDLHLHTGLSFDAWVYGNIHAPTDAYRFALGEPLLVPPLDGDGQPTQRVQLDRPLDFAMVTDHSEFLAEVRLCTLPGTAAYDSSVCRNFRRGGDEGVTFFGTQTALADPERFDICGDGSSGCFEEALAASWQVLQDAAEAYYDRTEECSFVTFVGYEYTATPDVVNLHRNVMFRNAKVLERPITYYEAPTYYALWRGLRDECLEGGKGCDVMTIGHNSNLSNGQYYQQVYGDASTPEQEAEAAGALLRLLDRMV